jgi:hypothetical protein
MVAGEGAKRLSHEALAWSIQWKVQGFPFILLHSRHDFPMQNRIK